MQFRERSYPVANGPAQPVRHGWVEAVLATGAFAILMAFSGAYDTDDLVIGHRLLLWAVIAALVVGQTLLADSLATRVAECHRLTRLAAQAAALLLMHLAVTLELHALKFTPLLPKRPDPLPDFLLFTAPPVLAMGLLVMAMRRLRSSPAYLDLLDDTAQALKPAGTSAPPQTPAPVIEGWPDGKINLVQAEDHYLRVESEAGAHFLRARLQDAMALLSDKDGVQVHRSWWVAHSFVAAIRRDGRDHVLLLTDGRTLPVGRGRVQTLREMGWIG